MKWKKILKNLENFKSGLINLSKEIMVKSARSLFGVVMFAMLTLLKGYSMILLMILLKPKSGSKNKIKHQKRLKRENNMSDRFSLQPICSVCGTNLDEGDEYGQMLMMSVGESIDLTCPKCGTVWRFWIEVVTHQKKISQKKLKSRGIN